MNRDLTVGKPTKVLWQFCLPLFGSVLFQQFYNLADSFVAGKFIGEHALAAVGNSYEITLIFIAIAFGANIGTSVITARLFGAKQYGSVRAAVSTSFLASAAICLVLMASGILFGDWLLNCIQTPKEIFADSKLYLDIYIYGLPFVFFYNISTGIFSSLGDSRTPFYFLSVSSVTNIAVDILFVKQFSMGVAGVAWATFLCQGVSAVLATVCVLSRLKKLPAGEAYRRFDWGLLGSIAKIAVPSMLQQSFVSVGNIIIQSVINGFGPAVIAGYAASVKLNNLIITSFITIGNGISSFTAQNLGAQKPERVGQGLRAGMLLVWLLGLPVMLLYFFGGRLMMPLFIDNATEEALRSGTIFLRILAPFYPVVAAKLASDGVLRGAGRMKAFVADTFTDLILRVVLAILLSKTVLGSTGIWWAWPVGWSIATMVSLYCTRDYLLMPKKRRMD